MNKDSLERVLNQCNGMNADNKLCDVVAQAKAFGFHEEEVNLVKKWYINAAFDYRSRHPEPDTISARLDYAESVKDYSAAYARKLMAKKIDGDQLRLNI